MDTAGHKRLLRPRAGTSQSAPAIGLKQKFANQPQGAGVQPRTFLLNAARQSGIGDPESCRTILLILEASRCIRAALGHELGFHGTSGSRFSILLTLYALDPLPSTVADLADQAAISRPSIIDVIETLERRGLIACDTSGRDRNTPILLTELGRQISMRAVQHFLEVASKLAGGVSLRNRTAVAAACTQIQNSALQASP